LPPATDAEIHARLGECLQRLLDLVQRGEDYDDFLAAFKQRRLDEVSTYEGH